ncbi:MAG: hypothetical protein NTZ72_13955 [Afipia sp.]|nr:hypothetical protein [Afipia sp.]
MTEDIDSNDKLKNLDAHDQKNSDDFVHEINETDCAGQPLLKTKYRATIESVTTDDTSQAYADDEHVNFDSLDGESADDEKDTAALLRDVPPRDAKQQIKEKLNSALACFELPKLPKEPANDNYRPVVSWPLLDQLTRSTFEPSKERRNKFILAARYIRELIDLVEADPLGNKIDTDIQRTESGDVDFGYGQTLDRKKQTYKKKDEEAGAVRFDGSARTSKKSMPIGNNANCNEPFALRVTVAREELQAIRFDIGTALWPLLVATISENASLTDIGLKLGARGGQAPPVGSAIIRLALTAAIDALDRLNGIKDEPPRSRPVPLKIHGSFLNQAKGAVIKRAA